MPPSETHESLAEQLIELTGKVREALDGEEPTALLALAEENKRLTGALASWEPDAGDSAAMALLVEARDCVAETRSALRARRDDLVQERRALDTRQKLGQTYGTHG